MPVTLKQFFASLLLRICAIKNLDPGAALAIRDIRSELVLGDDSFQVQLADALKQGGSRVVNVINIFQSRTRWNPIQQTPKLLLSVDQPLRAPILASEQQQIESEEARCATMEEQVFKLRSTMPIHTDDLAIDHSLAIEVKIGSDCGRKITKRSELMAVA